MRKQPSRQATKARYKPREIEVIMSDDGFNKLSIQLYATQVLAAALAKLYPQQD